jgi:hypothetical protein
VTEAAANIFAEMDVFAVLIWGRGFVMLLRTICLLILGIISFALFLALSEIGGPAGM